MRTRLSSTNVAAFLLATTAAACGGTTVTELSGPGAVRCLTSFGTPPPTVPASGGSAAVTISAERECTWSARGDSAWLQVSPGSGQGEASVTIRAGANPSATPRSTDLIVNDQRLTVRQEPAPCRYELDAREANVPAAGGRVSVRVSVVSGCEWSAASTQPWVHVLTASIVGGGAAELAVDANPGAARTAQVTIAGEPFTITQLSTGSAPAPVPPTPTPPAPPGPPPPPPPPAPGPPPTPPASCSYTIDPRFRSVNARERNGDLKVQTASGCAWTADATVGWISITSGSSGSGSGTVEYRIAEHDGRADRMGTIRVAGQTLLIQQGGRRGSDDDDDDDNDDDD